MAILHQRGLKPAENGHSSPASCLVTSRHGSDQAAACNMAWSERSFRWKGKMKASPSTPRVSQVAQLAADDPSRFRVIDLPISKAQGALHSANLQCTRGMTQQLTPQQFVLSHDALILIEQNIKGLFQTRPIPFTSTAVVMAFLGDLNGGFALA